MLHKIEVTQYNSLSKQVMLQQTNVCLYGLRASLRDSAQTLVKHNTTPTQMGQRITVFTRQSAHVTQSHSPAMGEVGHHTDV